MYVYKQTERWKEKGYAHYLYTVGYYEPSGKWIPESDHDNTEGAVERVSYLNGANPDLLEACEWLLENYGVPYDIETTTKVLEAKEVKMLDKIELIINKAKGK